MGLCSLKDLFRSSVLRRARFRRGLLLKGIFDNIIEYIRTAKNTEIICLHSGGLILGWVYSSKVFSSAFMSVVSFLTWPNFQRIYTFLIVSPLLRFWFLGIVGISWGTKPTISSIKWVKLYCSCYFSFFSSSCCEKLNTVLLGHYRVPPLSQQ